MSNFIAATLDVLDDIVQMLPLFLSLDSFLFRIDMFSVTLNAYAECWNCSKFDRLIWKLTTASEVSGEHLFVGIDILPGIDEIILSVFLGSDRVDSGGVRRLSLGHLRKII